MNAAMKLVVLTAVLSSSNVMASPEDNAVKALLEAQSKAESSFPRTLDVAGVLKFYSPDAVNITNGKLQTLEDTKKSLEVFEEMINLGKQIGISNRRINISTKVLSPNYVLATFDFTSKAAAAGEVMFDVSGKCSTIFKKTTTSWGIQHEHCSYAEKPEEVAIPDAVPAPEIQ